MGRRRALAILGALGLAAGCSSTAEWQTHYDAGRGHVGKREWARAIAELEAAAELDPDSADTRLVLGDAYTGAGRFEDALKATERIIRSGSAADLPIPQRTKTYRRLGVLTLRGAYGSGDTSGLQRASTWFDKWIETDPSAYEAHLGKGLCLLKLQRFFDTDPKRDDAWGRFTEAAKHAPVRPEAIFHRARAGDLSGQVPAREVADAYRKALAVAPKGGRPEGPYAELPAVALDYTLTAAEHLLDFLRRSPAAAGDSEEAVRQEAQGLVKRLTVAGKKVSRGVEQWLGMGAAPSITENGTPTVAAGPAPPTVLTPAWLHVRVEPAGRPFVFEIEAEGAAKPDLLAVTVDGRDNVARVESMGAPTVARSPTGEALLRARFRVTVPLEVGEHRIALVPVDARGGRAIVPWEATVRGRAARTALVAVGHDGPGAAWAPGAEADASAAAHALGERLAAEGSQRRVLLGADATPAAVRAALRAEAMALDATDSLVVYLAAAGGAGPDGAPALAMGGTAEAPAWLPLADVAAALRGTKAASVVLAVDAGFQGPGGRALGTTAPQGAATAALTSLATAGAGRVVLLGANLGTAGAGGDPLRGLFTVTLLEALTAPEADTDGDGALTAAELAAWCEPLAAFRGASHGLTQDVAVAGDVKTTVIPANAR